MYKKFDAFYFRKYHRCFVFNIRNFIFDIDTSFLIFFYIQNEILILQYQYLKLEKS